MSEQPQGKTMRELRAIVDADQRRWNELAQYWNDLLDHEQTALIAAAREMAYGIKP